MGVKIITPGANLTYLAPPVQFFMGAKSFLGTLEMQRILVFKDELFCTMKINALFPWQQIPWFLSIGVCISLDIALLSYGI